MFQEARQVKKKKKKKCGLFGLYMIKLNQHHHEFCHDMSHVLHFSYLHFDFTSVISLKSYMFSYSFETNSVMSL